MNEEIEVSYLDPAEQGATLFEKAVDVHVIDGEEFVARWYYSPLDSDLTIWFDSTGAMVRYQLNAAGQVVDWSQSHGLQTGLIVELELGRDVAETIRFDFTVSLKNLLLAESIFEHCESLSASQRDKMIAPLRSFRASQVRTGNAVGPVRISRLSGSRSRFWKRFKRWTTGG